MKLSKLEYIYNKQDKLEELTSANHGIQGSSKITLQLISLMIEGCEFMGEIETFKFWKLNKKRNLPEAREEAIDCLHFIMAIIINLGVSIEEVMTYLKDLDESLVYQEDDLEACLELGRKLYGAKENITLDEQVNHIFSWYITSLASIIIGVRNKEVNIEDLAMTLVIVLSLCEAIGMSADDIVEEYSTKNNINFKRQKEKY